MSHKRVSQLVELTSGEVQPNDLFYIIDTSAREGKKIQVTELSNYLVASGSLHALTSDTASWANNVNASDVIGQVVSASHADSSQTSISSSFSTRTISGSYALSASYVANSSNVSSSWASSSVSSSWANVAVTATNATNASFLTYPNTSTASYAVSAGSVLSSSYAKTASYIHNAGLIESASWADVANYASASGYSATTDYLQFNGTDNGTASYALNAGSFADKFNYYGFYDATDAGDYHAQIDNLLISPSGYGAKETSIEAMGSATLLFTSSLLTNYTISLILRDRISGDETIADEMPVFLNVSRTVNNWDSLMSGSISVPWSLAYQDALTGSILVEVTSSSRNLILDSIRNPKFKFSSFSDVLTAQGDETLDLWISPTSSIVFNTTQSGGPYTDDLAGLRATGSQNVTSLELAYASIDSIRYTWKATALTYLDCQGNTGLQSLDYKFPSTLSYFYCNGCDLSHIYSLQNTSLIEFDCSNNDMAYLPTLPNFMPSGTLNAATNSITSTPSTFPSELYNLYFGSNSLTGVSSSIPGHVETMSFAGNTSLTSFTSALPYSMSTFDISHTQISSLPTLPEKLKFFTAISCSLTTGSMDSIASQLYLYGRETGSINIRGNGVPSGSTINYLNLLEFTRNWTVAYDSYP